ncbi:hypothetical protein JIG36_28975 [Actinoplanes sp. LDG1-06]|uniref:Uncharacterized protein n=1 Tax=Paractinoplanes ovalisporus TaxID=2810368 RepID=A0ABS2AIA9_9ACTN|nr:DUF6578 domain-containing protein [Actinoplanes ovalisporus]MBM2619584.1 hypothetical protein [Actinoplanes ovalisporus]
MPLTVWIAHWQMNCCGTPFRRGDAVSWRLRTPQPAELDWLDAATHNGFAATVNAVEDHHGEPGTPPTAGTVASIAMLHCRFDPEPVAGSGLITPVAAAAKWTSDLDDRFFAGFLVRLHTPNPDNRPATPSAPSRGQRRSGAKVSGSKGWVCQIWWEACSG